MRLLDAVPVDDPRSLAFALPAVALALIIAGTIRARGRSFSRPGKRH